MRGILINPWTSEVTEVDVGDGIDPIYQYLSKGLTGPVGTFTTGASWDNGDIMYVDDEGLFKLKNRAFMIHDQTLVGMGLILGTDSWGSAIDAKSSLVTIQSEITWSQMEVRHG